MRILITCILSIAFGSTAFAICFLAVKMSVRHLKATPKQHGYKKPSSRDLGRFLNEEELSRTENGSMLDGRKAVDDFRLN